MLRFLTAGESHGRCLVAIVEGVPSGIKLNVSEINKELQRRQVGYGRGERMKIEKDTVEILSGVRDGKTIGSPITLKIENKDWENWKEIMSTEKIPKDVEKITKLRPGHADLAGAMKYDFKDIRNVIERASARETAIRTAVGAIAKIFLREFNIKFVSHVVQIGKVNAKQKEYKFDEICKIAEDSPLRCVDSEAESEMIKTIDEAKKSGDTVGGIFELICKGCPVGLGSYSHWDRRLDAKLTAAVMSIPGVKGVEFGLGFDFGKRKGTAVHDEIFHNENGFFRKTNNAGGIEGGISNGEDIVLRAVMKPISTLKSPLKTIDIETKKAVKAHVERTDTCVVPAAGTIAEGVVAIEIMNMFLKKFGGDNLTEIKRTLRKLRVEGRK